MSDTQVAFYARQRIKGYLRVRHFGFLANRCRAKRLVAIRSALAAPPPVSARAKTEPATYAGHPCPTCRKGQLHVCAHLAPVRRDPGGNAQR